MHFLRRILSHAGVRVLGLALWGCSVVGPSLAAEAPFAPGEVVKYTIKKMGMKAGKAQVTFKGDVDLDGRKLKLIVFRSEGFNFWDEEKIYVDPESFLPVRVERDLNIFGKKEKIIEYYSPPNGKIRIVKTASGKTTEEILDKDKAVENIYGFIYRYRMQGDFAQGRSLNIMLPTKEVTIQVKKRQTIKAGGQTYEAYYMESDSKEYRLWFDASEHHIPLRIDGAVGFGKTAMVMEEYHPGK